MKRVRRVLGLFAVVVGVVASAAAQQPAQPSIADTLPPPLPLDASGKPLAAPKSNLERADFSRALYVDGVGPTLKSATTIRKLVQDARELGFDTIVAQVRVYGDAFYQSDVVPRSSELKDDIDPLKVLIDEAHSGTPPIKVVALLSCLRVAMKDQTLPPKHVVVEHRDWLTQTDDGKDLTGDENNEYWLDSGVVAVQDHVALVAAEIARKYPVDGIQLDRVRLPGVKLNVGYNPQALERFKAEKGKGEKPAPNDPDWIEWRRQQLTEVVRKTREAVKAARANVEFSACGITHGSPAANREDFLRRSTPGAYALSDWQGWAEQGLVDAIAVTNYKRASTHAGDFEGWMNFALTNKGKAKVSIVVGGWLNDSKMTGALMVLPIFDPRADGVGLYSYHTPAAEPETPEIAFSLIKAILSRENLERRAPTLVDALSKPLTRETASSLTRLKQIAAVMAGGATTAISQAAPAPPPLTTTPASGSSTMPPLTQAVTAGTAQSALPPLSAAPPVTGPSMPVLGAPSTPSASSAVSGGERTLPPLTKALETGAAQPSGQPALPPLGQATSQPGGPVQTLATLPVLGESAPASPPSVGAPSLAPLGTAVQPAAAPAGVPALPALATPEAGMLPPLAAPPAPPSVATFQPPQVTPALPQLSALPPAPAEQELPVAAPAPATAPALAPFATPPAAQIPSFEQPAQSPFLEQRPSEDAASQIKRMGLPTEETRGSVTIPGSTGETNFSPAAVTTPAVAAPPYVPPSVIGPTPGQPTPAPVDVMGLLPTPKPVDRSNTAESPFIKTTPAVGVRNYAAQPAAPASASAPVMGVSEIIILKNGQQFAGQVLEKGTTWRIQLPNGSKIAIPASKIAGTRSMSGNE